MPVLTTRSLTKRYGRRTGVDGVDLAVAAGEIFGFLGPNGAGKSTTIRVLLGFLRPTSGSAQVFELDCWRQSARIKRDVGYIPGDLRLYPWLTARSALGLVGRVRGRNVTAVGDDLLDRFGLDVAVPVRKMSRGMRQKLGLVMALAAAPRLLVLDEPTTGLDPLMQNELLDILREMAARGTTVFLSSHVLGEVEQVCDRIAIVRRGRIVAAETIAALRDRARRRVTIVLADGGATATTPPEGLQIRERQEGRWRGEMSGLAGPLVAWAAREGVRDLTIEPPDLETLFHEFYQEEAP